MFSITSGCSMISASIACSYLLVSPLSWNISSFSHLDWWFLHWWTQLYIHHFLRELQIRHPPYVSRLDLFWESMRIGCDHDAIIDNRNHQGWPTAYCIEFWWIFRADMRDRMFLLPEKVSNIAFSNLWLYRDSILWDLQSISLSVWP